jgi:hypothetical protein
MFRDDREALAEKVEDLRSEQERLRAENEAMRADLLVRRQAAPIPRRNTYTQDVAHMSPGERAALTHHDVSAFPVWAALLLHFITFGLFPFIHLSLLHDKLPRAENDDPSGAKAIGFSFIPYFNLYWIVFNTLRLADRLNLQLRLRGQPDAIPRGFIIAAAVIGVIPYVNILFGYTIFWPIAVYYLQRGANALAALPREGGVATRARIATPNVRVQDLPGPDDVIQQEAEAEAEAAMRGTR